MNSYYLPPGHEVPQTFLLIKTDLGYHVLAGFGSDEWRLSTPIVALRETTARDWLVQTKSGSTYALGVDLHEIYRFTLLTEAVFTRFKDNADQNQSLFTVVPIEEVPSILEGIDNASTN